MSSDAIMNYPEFKYVAITIGGAKQKREIIELSKLKSEYEAPDCFRTWCRYKKDIIEYQKSSKGSLSGFDSKHYSDFLPIDIDNKKSPEKSLPNCRDLIALLDQQYELPIKSLRIYFSGSKGFHLEIPTNLFGDIEPSIELRLRFKKIVETLGFDDLDPLIYGRNWLWRFPNTINSKSGLYKIPLTYNELNNLNYDKIKELAKNPRYDFNFTSWNEWEMIESFSDLWKKSKPNNILKSNNLSPQSTIKIVNLNYPGAIDGERNLTAFQLALKLNAKGIKINEAKDYIVNKWNPTCKPPKKNIQNLKRSVESAYSYNHYDSGSIEITKHLRTDPYYNAMDSEQRDVYVYFICHINEVEKDWRHHICKPNQCIFSYGSVASHLDVGIQRIKTIVKNLVKIGRVTVETLNKDGKADCTRITFHNIDLTQYLTHQIDLSKNCDTLTHQLTTTNIIKERVKESSL